ncbi:hypothetical protein [Saccharopolyspora phatthalungensis]|uniref:Uncharacterized protein n=1 Tax=Saccharopolyspora phatthalungensis TaxID=664693 RepID=A0A840Q7Y0_9PSEU|nr:hypothetical protein [Saccharopolyspora phatthalungensis]MBB5154808.1 hypothetical protein [Saccharopolyspora phatthalungensis]
MVLINQRVADEIATLVARHRYGVEDSMDAVRAAESASAQKNEEMKAAADARKQELVDRAANAQPPDDKPRNDWAGKRNADSNEISFGAADDYEDAPQQTAARPVSPPPPAAPKPAPRRRPAYDDDDDFENQSWLR